MVNKLDKSGVMSVVQVTEKLDLSSINGRKWYIQGICAHTGDGVTEGL